MLQAAADAWLQPEAAAGTAGAPLQALPGLGKGAAAAAAPALPAYLQPGQGTPAGTGRVWQSADAEAAEARFQHWPQPPAAAESDAIQEADDGGSATTGREGLHGRHAWRSAPPAGTL